MNAADPCSGENDKLFPLRLCEVLEHEFVAIRGPLSSQPGWLLGADDICHDEVLVRLRASIRDPAPSPVGRIRERLERDGFRLPAAGPLDPEGRKRLLEALNQTLQAASDLYDYELLDPETPLCRLAELRRRAPAAGGQGPGSSGADEQTQLNRLLLEAAFPAGVIACVDKARLDRLFSEIHGQRGPDAMYSALCLSGGGIRSAAFALGVLQTLARRGILERFDYLSTVSGGGYVGSWLSTWIHRHPRGLAGVVDDMKAPGEGSGACARRIEPEPAPIRFLRRYSHFLNPKAGLFSADTWTWIGIYLRNLSLNWLLIIPFLLLLLALPHLYSALLLASRAAADGTFFVLLGVATAAAVSTVVCVTVNRPSLRDPAPREGGVAHPPGSGGFERQMKRLHRQAAVLMLGVAPLMLFAVAFTLLAWMPQADGAAARGGIGPVQVVLWGEAIVLGAWLIAVAILPQRDWRKRLEELAVMLIAGLPTWLALAWLSAFAQHGVATAQGALELWSFTLYPAHLYIVLAVPVVALAVLAGMTVFIGAVSKFRWIEDEDREWWGRFGAWILVCIFAWSALGVLAILGPPVLLESPRLLAALGGISGLVAILLGKSSLTAANAGKSAAAGAGQAKGVLAMVGINTLATVSALALALFLAFLALLGTVLLKALLVGLAAEPLRRACGRAAAWPWESFEAAGVFGDPQLHLEIACQTPLPIVALAAFILLAVLITANLLINVNKFSLHAAYRIRIIRTFLGATRQDLRDPNPFTGFDPLDNVQMHELQPGLLHEGDFRNLAAVVGKLQAALAKPDDTPAGMLARCLCSSRHDPYGILASRLRSYKPETPVLKSLQHDLLDALNRVLQTARFDGARAPACGSPIFANRQLIEAAFPDEIAKFEFPPPPPHKLMHVVNLTLNLISGDNLAWQERKAAPFSVTPMHAGSYYLGYRASRDYGGKNGISLGTAAAISGAAVSPNMGYSSSPVTTLLLALFNLRLGWWLGNPGVTGSATYRRSEPRLSLRPLLSEALGLTDDKSPYVYLSDGGHFENMGLFEMVQRRCRLIVATDAGADPDYEFEDLGNAVRKIRVDLGIPITFTKLPIHGKRRAGDEDSGRYCAIGRIRYADIDGKGVPDGVLIYFKPVLCGDEPQDVRQYAARNAVFPQESTLDQFFGESQFESYRQLGEFALETAWGALPASGKPWAVDLVERIRAYLGAEREEWLESWLNEADAQPPAWPRSEAA